MTASAYAVGTWAVAAALAHRPGRVRRVLLHPDAPEGERRAVEAAALAAGVAVVVTAGRIEALRRHDAAWSLVEFDPVDDALARDADHLVLVRAAQGGNVGAAWRSALGFGVHDVALIDARVAPWSAHALRASIGARFALRVAAFGDWEAYRAAYPDHAVIAFTARGAGTTPLPRLVPPPLAAWTFGPEAGGFPAEVTAGATLVSIPQADALESHNVAVAVGVGLYARAVARSG